MARGWVLLIVMATPVLAAEPMRPFVVKVVDDATGRGVPLVELRTVNEARYVTDSAGVAAILEPGLAGQKVFLHVKSHGYELPKDGFGYRGRALDYVEGGSAELRITRLNIAERLYRVTGGGIYRDSQLAGLPVPTRKPLINALVFGSDSVLNAVYRGKLHWFWGDTNRPGYPLGNFHVPGAVSDLPGQGGLDPEVGVDLSYFEAPNGFAAETARFPGQGPTWLGGLGVVDDGKGGDALVAGYVKIKPPMDTYEKGLAVFDPAKKAFDRDVVFPLDAPTHPTGHSFRASSEGAAYLYYTTPFPLARVRAELARVREIEAYEAFTCLETGSRLEKNKPARIDRGPDGRARHAWRRNTPPLGPGDESRLVKEGVLKPDETLVSLRDVETGKPVLAHGGTVHFNAYRKRWVALFVEFLGSSLLGEMWFAEADTPLGPWGYARKVVTHDKYSFYNPRHHPYFDKDGGRVVFFEGTYTTSFSGNSDPTPRYEYNQVMYKLDLADASLNLPVAVRAGADGSFTVGPKTDPGAPAAFFALERPAEGTLPVYATEAGGLRVGGDANGASARFHVLPPNAKEPPKATTPLVEYRSHDGRRIARTGSAPEGFGAEGKTLGHVWPAISRVRLPEPTVPRLEPPRP